MGRKLWLGVAGLVIFTGIAIGLWFGDCPAPIVVLSNDRVYPVHVLFYDWHSAIAWHQKDLPPSLRSMGAEQWRDAPIVEFGWGDLDFYFGGDESWTSIARMIFSSSPSVIHVASWQELPPVPTQTIFLDREGLVRLGNFVEKSFARGDQDHRQVLGQGQYGISNFYRAVQPYSLWSNCNGWTAQALHHGGLHTCPRRTFTIQNLRDQLSSLGAKACESAGGIRHCSDHSPR
jgi:hypothetical protein